MSATRLTPDDIRARKGGAPLVWLTSYTARMAELLDPHVDVLLVGDSLGMVLYGMTDTQAVTLEMMLAHGRAVTRAAKHACVVVDIPYHASQGSPESVFDASARVMRETGCHAVKLEGGKNFAPTIRHLTRKGIPVVGHVGLMPQHARSPEDFRYQGRTEEDAARILADARAVEEAGAFAIVIEAVREDVARHIVSQISVPMIGIGASSACDGQVLVIDDMLGMFDKSPRFVKHFANMRQTISQAVESYAAEVRNRSFPDSGYTYGTKK